MNEWMNGCARGPAARFEGGHPPRAQAPFDHFGDFDLECLPNRDSRPYARRYGLEASARRRAAKRARARRGP